MNNDVIVNDDSIKTGTAIVNVLNDMEIFPADMHKYYTIRDIYDIVDANVPDDVKDLVEDFHHSIRAAVEGIVYKRTKSRTILPVDDSSHGSNNLYLFM